MNLLIACSFSLTIFTGYNATNSDNNTSNNTNSTPAVNTIGNTSGNLHSAELSLNKGTGFILQHMKRMIKE
jgi:hypothetical protein